MNNYKPTNTISEKPVCIRMANRIKTIRGSKKIKGNPLSEEQNTDILDVGVNVGVQVKSALCRKGSDKAGV